MRRLLAIGAALLLTLAVSGSATASGPADLQPVTVACSVDSPFTLGADPETLTQLPLALAAMTDPTCAITQANPTASPAKEYAVGGGLDAIGQRFSFSAHQNTPNPPSGYAHVSRLGFFDVQGHVTCLNAHDTFGFRIAVFGFEIEKGTGQGSNLGALIFVLDGGPPGNPEPQPDLFSPILFTATPPTTCPQFTGTGSNPLVHGNIVVRVSP